MDCSPPGYSVHGISQARILEWAAIPFTRGFSRPRNWTCVSCIGRQSLPASREALLRNWSLAKENVLSQDDALSHLCSLHPLNSVKESLPYFKTGQFWRAGQNSQSSPSDSRIPRIPQEFSELPNHQNSPSDCLSLICNSITIQFLPLSHPSAIIPLYVLSWGHS